jgi:hypothetical protein
MRFVHRSIHLFVASAVSLSLAACGGGDDGGDDGGGDEVGGDHNQSVVSKMTLPEGNNTTLKLDIDGNGTKENKLGAILSALTSQSNGALDLQASLDRGINKGDIVLLSDVQASALTSASDAGFRVYLGTIVSPAACTNPEDEATCGKHLAGTGQFTAAASDSIITGTIVNGRFTGGPGTLTLKLSLEGTLITLNLINAKAEFSVTADGSIDGIVGGAITETELNSNVIPAIATTIQNIIATDCTGGTPETDCGCTAGSTGKTLLGLFDTVEDCAVTEAEVKESGFIKTLLGPDLDLLPPANDTDSLSVGVGVKTVKATWPE